MVVQLIPNFSRCRNIVTVTFELEYEAMIVGFQCAIFKPYLFAVHLNK